MNYLHIELPIRIVGQTVQELEIKRDCLSDISGVRLFFKKINGKKHVWRQIDDIEYGATISYYVARLVDYDEEELKRTR